LQEHGFVVVVPPDLESARDLANVRHWKAKRGEKKSVRVGVVLVGGECGQRRRREGDKDGDKAGDKEGGRTRPTLTCQAIQQRRSLAGDDA
jgi:hypothetical protein